MGFNVGRVLVFFTTGVEDVIFWVPERQWGPLFALLVKQVWFQLVVMFISKGKCDGEVVLTILLR